jgi:uncharacterized protein YjbJ (UPF0337 family)
MSNKVGAADAPARQYPELITHPMEDEMNNDKVKGTIDDAAGRAKRQVGEWTGDTRTQAEGAAQQVKGKIEKAVGNVKDAARDASDKIHSASDRDNIERERVERDRLAEERKHHEAMGS